MTVLCSGSVAARILLAAHASKRQTAVGDRARICRHNHVWSLKQSVMIGKVQNSGTGVDAEKSLMS